MLVAESRALEQYLATGSIFQSILEWNKTFCRNQLIVFKYYALGECKDKYRK